MYKAKLNSEKQGYVVEMPLCGTISILIPKSEIENPEELKDHAIELLINYNFAELGQDERTTLETWGFHEDIHKASQDGIIPQTEWDYYEEKNIPEYEHYQSPLLTKSKLKKISMSVENLQKLAKALILTNSQLENSEHWQQGKKTYANLTVLIPSQQVSTFKEITNFVLS